MGKAQGSAPLLAMGKVAAPQGGLGKGSEASSLRVLPFDPKGRSVAFDKWHDDLQQYLLSDSRNCVSLFDYVSGAAPAPPATVDVSTHSQWLSRDATARLAIRNHLLATECAHFGKHGTALALYDAVVARYSSPATAALGRLLQPYLFPELSVFATVADLVTHLRTSDARYRATVPSEFLPTNQPPMFITLYFIVTRRPYSLRSVRDHFLTLDSTSLNADLREQHLLAAESSAVAVGAAHGTPCSPFFEGCSPSPLSSSFTSAAAADVSVPEDDGAASTMGVVVGAAVEEAEAVEVVAVMGPVAEVEALVAAVEAAEGVAAVEAVGPMVVDLDLSVEALVVVEASSSSVGARLRRPGSSRRCFARLEDAWRTEFCDDVERPRWAELLGSGVAIFDLDFDVIISTMYALSFSAEGDSYSYVPPDLGIAAAALGASASGTPLGTAPAEALHTFTLDSGASCCFFRDSTTLTPLPAPVPVRLADPSGGPVVASSSTVLPCPAYRCPSGCDGHYHHSWGSECVDLHVHTDGASPGYVSASGQVAASCSCRLLSHQTLLWHHRLGHPSLPRLRGMHSRLLVSGLPRSLPPLPPSSSPHYLPCVEGRQRATPHSSSFPPTTAPLQTLHMDMKGEVSAVLIPWIRTVRLQLRERFGQDLPVLRLHSDRGGEFSSDLLRDFCRGEDILLSFTLPDSPQQNGIAKRRIGLVMEVTRTSMIHAAAPHFLWSFAVRYAAHQLNLWPRVSLPETSPTLRWTGKVGDASVFRVWGSCAFVRDTSADKLSACAIPCVFLGFVPHAPGWQFYHPTSRRVFPSQDVTFDESVPFYRLFPYRSFPSPPPPLFLAPGPPPVDPLPPQGPAPSGVSQVDPLPCTAPVQVAIVLSAAPGAASGGAASGGVEPGGVGSEGARSGDAEPEGVEPEGAESEGAEPGGAVSEGADSGGAEPRGPGEGGAGAAGAGAADPGAGGAGGTVRPHPYFVPLLQQILGVPSSTGLTERREPASRPVSPICTARCAPCSRPPPVPGTHTMALRPSSVPLRVPMLAPPESSLPEASDPESDRARAAIPLVARLLAIAVTDPSFESAATSALVAELLDFAAACRLDYASALVAESVSASPPFVGAECAVGTDVLEDRQEDFECLAAAVPRFASLLLAPEGDPDAPDIPTPRSSVEAITGPYSSQWQAAMDAEMASWKSTGTYDDEVCPPGVNIVDGMWIFRVKRSSGSPPAFKARYVARGFSQRQGVDYFQTFSPTPKMSTLRVLLHVAAQCDYELHSLFFSTAFLHGSLHEIWLRQPPGFTGSFPTGTQWSLRRPVYGLRQAPRDWHNTLRTTLAALGFVPSTANPSLFLRTDTSLPPFYVLVYVDDLVFTMADTEALTLVKSELQKRHTCTDLGELRSYLGLQITRDRARRTITLTQSHMVNQVLQRFGFQYSSPQLTPLSTSHSLSAPPSDESVEPSGPYPELVGCLMYLMTCTRPDLAYPLSLLARYVAPGRHRKVHWDATKRVMRYLCSTSGMGLVLGGRGPVVLTGHADASWVDDSATLWSWQGYTFGLGSGSVSWRSTRSSSVLSSSCEAEIYAGAMAAQELPWLTYLLTELGEQPRSPPVLYVDNKAMIALCQEHRLEHRTKHIALRYFLSGKLQQRGQLRLAYVATWVNTGDVFTKALPPVDHQRFVIVLGLVPTLPHLLPDSACTVMYLYTCMLALVRLAFLCL
ncbi:unnamed protein product [Closterium sp. NIES-53]